MAKQVLEPLEGLLRDLENVNEILPYKKEYERPGLAKGWETAEKSATIHDFFKMVGLIVEYSMDDLECQYGPDDNRYYFFPDDNNKSLNNPVITYKVKRRTKKDEYKPIVREYTVQKDKDGIDRKGTVWGQRFQYSVQFNIFGNDAETVDNAMDRFEEMMVAYAGHIKGQGVAEYYLLEQIEDGFYTSFRETICTRNLIYYVEIDKLLVIFNEKIKDIPLLGDIKKEDSTKL